MIRRNNHLKIGRYHQHLHELLDLDLSPLDYMMKEFPEFKEREEMRKVIGRYGLTGYFIYFKGSLVLLCTLIIIFKGSNKLHP